MSHSLASLRRWGVTDKELPAIDQIKHIHVYDFDNTLFKTPLPSKALWDKDTLGFLQRQDVFANGGWWHDSNILAATGKGADEEEKTAWDGFWNQHIVNLAQLSMKQEDALIVLLTGRSEKGFSGLIQRMVAAKGLHFHLICLQPVVAPTNQKFESTAKFKQGLLEEVMHTYRNAIEIRVYEDREKHVKMFKTFFQDFNNMLATNKKSDPRSAITAEVIRVPENVTDLDPVTEVAEVQRMLNSHNEAFQSGVAPSNANQSSSKLFEINRNVLFTGYLVSPSDTEKLLALVEFPRDPGEPRAVPLGNNIMINHGPSCPRSVLEKVGGIGKKLVWRVVAVGNFDKKIWAARVEPVPPTERIHCADPVPYVLLGYRRATRATSAHLIQNWTSIPESKQFEFETTVGEKVLLRIRGVHPRDRPQENKPFKRPQNFDDQDFPSLGGPAGNPSKLPNLSSAQNQQQSRNFSSGPATPYARVAGANGQQRGRGNPHFHGRGGASGGGRGGGGGAYSHPSSMRGGPQRGGMNGVQAGRGRGRGGQGHPYRSLDDDSGHGNRRDGGSGGHGGLIY